MVDDRMFLTGRIEGERGTLSSGIFELYLPDFGQLKLGMVEPLEKRRNCCPWEFGRY